MLTFHKLKKLYSQQPTSQTHRKNGYSPGAYSILNESFDYPKHLLTPLQTAYFRNLQWKSRKELSGAPTSINVNKITKRFTKWKEITSTAPSNRHLGHYKSLLVADGHYKIDENQEMSNKI